MSINYFMHVHVLRVWLFVFGCTELTWSLNALDDRKPPKIPIHSFSPCDSTVKTYVLVAHGTSASRTCFYASDAKVGYL
jgi:hypothetical protein